MNNNTRALFLEKYVNEKLGKRGPISKSITYRTNRRRTFKLFFKEMGVKVNFDLFLKPDGYTTNWVSFFQKCSKNDILKIDNYLFKLAKKRRLINFN